MEAGVPPLEALPTPVEEVLRRGVQSLISFTIAAMLSKDLRMRLCANSRASHATLGGVCCGSASPAQHDFFKYRSKMGFASSARPLAG